MPFFPREDANPTGIRRLGVMVKFQGTDHEILRYAMETLLGVISALRAAPSRAHIRLCRVTLTAK